jgi:hypothetical protein
LWIFAKEKNERGVSRWHTQIKHVGLLCLLQRLSPMGTLFFDQIKETKIKGAEIARPGGLVGENIHSIPL